MHIFIYYNNKILLLVTLDYLCYISIEKASCDNY